MAELPLSVEERLAALEAVVNKLKAPPMDLLLQEGYLQLGSSGNAAATRLSQSAIEMTATNASRAAIVWSKLLPALGGNATGEGARITGRGSGGVGRLQLEAHETLEATSGNEVMGYVSLRGNSNDSVVEIGVQDAGRSVENAYILIENNSTFRQMSLVELGLGLWSDTSDPTLVDNGAIWYRSDLEKLRLKTASGVISIGEGGGMTIKVKEADESVTTSTTLQNDDELLFAVAANEVWQFEGSMFIDTTSSADFRFAVTGPSGAVGRVFAAYSDTAAFDAHVGAGDLGDTIDLQTANTGTLVRFWGGIHNGANAGNLQVQWAQRVSQGTATTVHAGSYIKYQQANV